MEDGTMLGIKMIFQQSRLLLSTIAIIFGSIVSMLLGFLENFTNIGAIGATGFGYPLPWRFDIIYSATKTIYRLDNLATDLLFWVTICFFVLLIIEKILFSSENSLLNNKKFILIMALLIPLGLLTALIHEIGHAFWGTAIGGTISQMQIGYIVIYPKLEIVSQFKLGSTIITGLSTSFQHGLFLLAGSLTTNIAAWLILLLINTRKLGIHTKVSFKILGYFGVFDLPFYIIFPILGLRHWILFGETQPEPLIGARELGIPETGFFVLVLIITLILIL
ncbi:MAG: M50 family metallopeptidase, partial [Candidatus Bathyarchaeota archaeon]